MKKILLSSITLSVLMFSIAYADVNDTTPPVITPPADQSFTATTFPASPTLVLATATDDTDPNPTITYDPVSFPVGSTTITWTATDVSGNASTATSQVTMTDATPAPAPVAIHLEVETATSTIFDEDVTVSACSTPNNATATVNGLCAFDAASLPITTTVFPFGIQIDSIDGVASGAFPNSWLWFINGDIASTGIDSYILQEGDTVLWTLGVQPLTIDVSKTTPTVGDPVTVTVTGFDASMFDFEPVAGATLSGLAVTTDTSGIATLTATSTSPIHFTVSAPGFITSPTTTIQPVAAPSGSGGGGKSSSSAAVAPAITTKAKFDLKKAFDFLLAQQKEDGSFGEDMYTDWVAVALASGNYQAQTIKLIKYLGESKLSGNLLTDYERHAIALMAFGLSPYNANGENYIEKITARFDGTQFGDLHEDNDDIFALIVMQNAGFKPDEKMLTDDMAFILSAQRENGSWDESVDMTGAAMEALTPFDGNEQVKNALVKAKEFLKENQKDNGSWSDNVSSTAWALQGIYALGEKAEDWTAGGSTALDYLATVQDTDGGIKEEKEKSIQSKIWETAYVVTAYSGKTWNETMQKFAKPNDTGTGSVLGASTEVKTNVAPKKVTAIAKTKPKTLEKATTEITAPTVSAPKENNIQTPEPKQESWFIRFLKMIWQAL